MNVVNNNFQFERFLDFMVNEIYAKQKLEDFFDRQKLQLIGKYQLKRLKNSSDFIFYI